MPHGKCDLKITLFSSQIVATKGNPAIASTWLSIKNNSLYQYVLFGCGVKEVVVKCHWWDTNRGGALKDRSNWTQRTDGKLRVLLFALLHARLQCPPRTLSFARSQTYTIHTQEKCAGEFKPPHTHTPHSPPWRFWCGNGFSCIKPSLG